MSLPVFLDTQGLHPGRLNAAEPLMKIDHHRPLLEKYINHYSKLQHGQMGAWKILTLIIKKSILL